MPEAITDSQWLSITLRHPATGNNFKYPKFITVTSQYTGIAVLDEQRVAERYCSVRHTVPPQRGHSGTDRPSTESQLPLPPPPTLPVLTRTCFYSVRLSGRMPCDTGLLQTAG
jgi:hypothetical protein